MDQNGQFEWMILKIGCDTRHVPTPPQPNPSLNPYSPPSWRSGEDKWCCWGEEVCNCGGVRGEEYLHASDLQRWHSTWTSYHLILSSQSHLNKFIPVHILLLFVLLGLGGGQGCASGAWSGVVYSGDGPLGFDHTMERRGLGSILNLNPLPPPLSNDQLFKKKIKLFIYFWWVIQFQGDFVFGCLSSW